MERPKRTFTNALNYPPAVEENLSQAPQGACPSCLVGEEYHVSRPTIHKTLARGRKHDFSVYTSCNAHFLEQGWGDCAYTIEAAYTDNSREIQGNPEHHAFAERCMRNGIGRKFTRPATPKTHGKAERVLWTLMEMWHDKKHFEGRKWEPAPRVYECLCANGGQTCC